MKTDEYRINKLFQYLDFSQRFKQFHASNCIGFETAPGNVLQNAPCRPYLRALESIKHPKILDKAQMVPS